MSHHYLGENIQNEIIQNLQGQINNKIVSLLKTAKYYSIILYSIPDISGVEQITIIVHFVNINTQYMKMNEYFLGFVPVLDTNGLGLTEFVLKWKWKYL